MMASGLGTVSFKIKGRFGRGSDSRFSEVFRPIVAWNLTARCNLSCRHCYIEAGPRGDWGMGTEEALDLVDQMARANIPLILMTGGEPLTRGDFFHISEYAASKGIKLVLSTNGTLIDRETARRLADIGFAYVGVSLDSPDPRWHDEFRGRTGAFEAAVRGIRNAVDAGLDVGLRFTITAKNIEDLDAYMGLAVKLGVRRVTLYHLSAAGRARAMGKDWWYTPETYSRLMDRVLEHAKRLAGRLEIETTLAPFDGIYVADRVSRSTDEFWEYMALVESMGSCGRKIVSVYPNGDVYPCQFVDFVRLGNVRSRPLDEVLSPDNPALDMFVNTDRYLRGPKCSSCPFKRQCKGGDRARAYYLAGDMYGDDPLCPLDVHSIAGRWPRRAS